VEIRYGGYGLCIAVNSAIHVTEIGKIYHYNREHGEGVQVAERISNNYLPSYVNGEEVRADAIQ